MKRRNIRLRLAISAGASMLAALFCEADANRASASVLQLSDTFVRGEGMLGWDSFNGEATVTLGGVVQGRWDHTTEAGDVLIGQVDALTVAARDPDGMPVADWGGPATWNGAAGYRYRARIVRGNGSETASYSLTVRDSGGTPVYLAAGDTTNGTVVVQAGSAQGPPPPDPLASCRVTGGGSIQGDSFGGNATELDGPGNEARGEWQHTTAGGDVWQGSVIGLECFMDGGAGPGVPPAPWNHVRIFLRISLNRVGVVRAADRGEPGNADEYNFVVFDESFLTIYSSPSGLLDGGNIQIHQRR